MAELNKMPPSVSVTGIWIIFAVCAAVAAASAATGSWWIAGGGSALALVLCAYVAGRARNQCLDMVGDLEQARKEARDSWAAATNLSQAVSASPLPLAVFDSGRRLTAASTSFARLTNNPESALLGRDPEQILGAEAAQAMVRAKDQADGADAAMASGEPVRIYCASLPGGGLTALAVPRAGDLKCAAEADKRLAAFQEATYGVNELAQRLAGSSELMSAYADEQATGANRQKEQTEAVAATMEKMMRAVMDVASNASATSDAADEARGVAREGADLVHRAVNGINSLAASARELAEELGGLDNQAGEIGRIIGVISDIADQTNLLALNAAIEAARAGDAGRGFAVVADEVRKLAEKTMQATGDVEAAVRSIQHSSKQAMDSMHRTGQQVEESTELSNSAGQSLEQVMEHIEGMVGRVRQIASAAEEQSSAAEDISGSVEEIASIARDSDEGATQQAYATKDIAQLSAELLRLSQSLSGGGEGPKLQASGQQMRGVLPELMQRFVRDEYGDEVFEAMQEEMGDPTFLPSESYPDAVLVQMAELVQATSGDSRRKIFYKFGLVTVEGFHRLYKRYFRAKTLKEFYMTMNDVHAQVTKDMPGARPPKFTFEDKGDVLFMNYTSPRALFDYFEGILNGAAAFFDQRVEVKIKPLDEETARAEIHFLDGKGK
ncbi:methyl-accepting chemotaxis protein [Desulfocurvus sp. DL9XJH121]